jgi:thymidylate synthase ThyX
LGVEGWGFIVPESIVTNKQMLDIAVSLVEKAIATYRKLLDLGIPPEDAEYALLPHVRIVQE